MPEMLLDIHCYSSLNCTDTWVLDVKIWQCWRWWNYCKLTLFFKCTDWAMKIWRVASSLHFRSNHQLFALGCKANIRTSYKSLGNLCCFCSFTIVIPDLWMISTRRLCGLVTEESVWSISTWPLDVRFSFKTIKPFFFNPVLNK